MQCFVDLHIHSALSPCSEDDMTPNNIVNMAILKGLDIISVTDHNSARNLLAIQKCADKAGLIFVPGMEIETSEEIHMVCYFPDVAAAMRMQEIVYNALPKKINREDIFGKQIVYDEYDEIVEIEHKFLLTASNINLDEVCNIVKSLGGIALPAHIDRDSYSILSNLGVMPEEPIFNYLELSKRADLPALMIKHPEIEGHKFLVSSDAHRLWEVLEKQTVLDVKNKTVEGILETLKRFNLFGKNSPTSNYPCSRSESEGGG